MAKKVTKISPVESEHYGQSKRKLRVCAYCRVSTDAKEQHNSFATQMMYYKEKITQENDWEYAGIYADEAKSGTKLKNRDDFLRMLADCEAGKIDMILTKSITRFARNTVDSISVIRRLKALGISVFFEKENMNTLWEHSEQMLTILSSLAQGESESISTNNKWANTKRFQDGTYKIACPPLGYDKDTDGQLVINEEEAKIVEYIFNEYLSGKGAYLIAKALTEKNVPTMRKGKSWSVHSVTWILKNPIYGGNLLLQKTYTTEVLPFTKKKNKGELPRYFISENHIPVIGTEQMEKVDKIFEQRRREIKEGGSWGNLNRYAFSGKIICKECGRTFRRQKIYMGKSYEKIRWNCKGHIENGELCKTKAVREDVIIEAFVTMWNKLVENGDEILLPLLASLKKLRLDSTQEQELIQCDEKIMELATQSQLLTEVVWEGDIGSALFIQKRNAIQREIAEVKKQKNLIEDNNGYALEIKKTEALLDLIKEYPTFQEAYDESIFLRCVEKIIIDEMGAITFQLNNKLELTEVWKEGG